ncbi:putative metal-dependent RNase [Pseudomonas sp. IT-P218]
MPAKGPSRPPEASLASQLLQGLRAGLCVLVVGDGWARADQVAVAEDVVDSAYGRPVFAVDQGVQRINSLLTAVRMRPLADQFRRGVRSVLQRVVVLVQRAVFHCADFFADADHGVAEAVQFFPGFAFGRLDHQRARYREGHGRGVEAKIDQALGDVIDADAAAVFQWAQVEDAFMRDQAVAAGVQHWIVLFQATGNVVGVEDCQLRSTLETRAAHHADVHPGDRQNARAAERCRADRAFLAGHLRMAWQERGQVRLDADRADARAATAVRNAEGLVQVQVRHVAAELARGAQADHGVHVGAVDVHLAAVVVDDAADFADAFLEHAVGRRVGDHQRGEVFAVLDGLGAQVFDVDVAAGVAGGDDDTHAGHLRGGRVGAVGRGRDQADVAAVFATALVVGADGQQAGVFTLGTGVRLQRDRVVAGGGAEHRFQFIGQLLVAGALLGRGERVQGAEFSPGHRDHFAGGVEFHGARAQRDHGAIEGQVLVGELAQVAHQLGFRVVAVEHRVAEDWRLAHQGGRDGAGDGSGEGGEVRQGLARGEQCPQDFDVGLGAGFVQGEAQTFSIDHAQVDLLGMGLLVQLGDVGASGNRQGVEEVRLFNLQAQCAQAFGQNRSQVMHTLGNLRQAFRTVVHGVHAGDVGQQHLRGADVRRGLLAADVLLAGLHRQAQGRLAETVDRDTDQAARHVALERILGGEVGRVRATEAQRHAEALRAADGHIGAEFARRGQQGQGQQVGGHGHQGVGGVQALGQFAVVEHVTVARRVLQQGAEERRHVRQFALVANDYVDAQRLGTGAQHVEGLRVAMHGGEELVAALVLAQALAEGHGFGGGGGFIQQRGVGDRQAGEVADQGLEVQQGFEAALGNFRLVRGVGGVPGRVFQEVAQDRRRRVGAVVTLADEGLEQLVLAGDAFDHRQGIGFAQAVFQAEHAGALDAVGDDAGAQGFEGIETEGVEHGLLVTGAGADVAGDEFVMGVEADGHGVSSRVGLVLDQALVGSLVQQLAYSVSVSGLEAEEPALAQRIFVDQLRGAVQFRIHFQHLAVQRHADAAGGFHRFQHRHFGTGIKAAQFGHLNEHHIPQGLLGKRRDANGDSAVSFGAQPFVIDGKTQFAHINSSLFRLIRCRWRRAMGRLALELGWRRDSKGGAKVELLF